MISELLKLGLSAEEARLYTACLEINGGSVSVLARKAGFHRVSAYHTVEKLTEKRLLTQYNRNGVKCFAPEPPEKLEELLKEKINLARSIIPQLKALSTIQGFRPKIRVYEGRDGVERVFQESLDFPLQKNSKKNHIPQEILGYTNLKMIQEFFPDFFKKYTKERFEKGIKARYLSPKNIEGVQKIDPFLPKNYDPNLLEILLVNQDQFPFDNEILLFGSSVGIVSLRRDELLGVIIESATFARTMKAIFDLAWLGATAFVAG